MNLESAADAQKRSSGSGKQESRKGKKKKLKQQNPNRITRLCRFIKHLFTPLHPPHPHSAPSPFTLARPTLGGEEEDVQQKRLFHMRPDRRRTAQLARTDSLRTGSRVRRKTKTPGNFSNKIKAIFFNRTLKTKSRTTVRYCHVVVISMGKKSCCQVFPVKIEAMRIFLEGDGRTHPLDTGALTWNGIYSYGRTDGSGGNGVGGVLHRSFPLLFIGSRLSTIPPSDIGSCSFQHRHTHTQTHNGFSVNSYLLTLLGGFSLAADAPSTKFHSVLL